MSPMQAAANTDAAAADSLYATTPLPGPAMEVLPASAEATTPGKVQKWVLDPTFGDWRLVEVDDEPITVTDMIEPRDHAMHDMDLGPAWEAGRGQHMSGWWASIDPDQRIREHMNGYAPVRPENAPELKDRGYRIFKDPHLGEVYRFGDTVLMEQPKAMHDDRKAREEAGRKRDAEYQAGYGAQELDEYSRSAGGGRVVRYQNESRFGGFGGDSADPRIMMEASSEAEAMMARNAFLERESDNRGSTSRTFGGFTGPMDGRGDDFGPKKNYGYVPPSR